MAPVVARYALERAALAGPGLDDRFGARVEAGLAPASAHGLGLGGRLLASGGSAAAGVPRPGADTAFRIASCTKSLTAAAALQLRDAGLLDLDAPLDTWLAVRTTGGPVPTVRQLLSMSGGLPTDDPWADRQESISAGDLDALAARGVRLVRAPGTGYEYSNLGFALVGRVLERVSGLPFVPLVTQRLLEPLELTGLGFDQQVDAPGGVAVGHVRRDGAWQPEPFSAPGAFSPIGGAFATARALVRWTGWLAAAWGPPTRDDGDDGAVLSAASRREMQTATTRIDERSSYGLGLVVHDSRHGPLVSHSGGYPGYSAHMRWHPATGLVLVGLESARYSRVVEAVAPGLVDVLDSLAVVDELPELWPQVLVAREGVERLLRRWDDEVAAALLSPVVHLDEPLERRRAQLAALAERVGLGEDDDVLDLALAGPVSDSPASLEWSVPGSRGCLRVGVLLTPEAEPRVQWLEVRAG